MAAMMTDEELIDRLAELYPGEVPSNEQIFEWVLSLEERSTGSNP